MSLIPGRNDPCPCGSGRKYKHCCLSKDEAASAERVQPGAGADAASWGLDPALREHVSDVWEMEAVPFAARFTEEPAARPVVVLVVSGGLVVHANVVAKAPAEPEELALLLRRDVDAAIAAADRTPRRINVRHPSVARALGPLLQDRGIEVHSERHLAMLREAARAACDSLSAIKGAPMASLPETWAGWDLPNEDVARLFRAAAAYCRARAWAHLADTQPIVATLANGAQWHAVVLGNGGQEFGLALYSERADLERLYREKHPGRAARAMHGMNLAITYCAGDDLPPRMRREIREAGWELAGPAAYPLFTVMGTPAGGVTRGQLAELITLLECIPRFVASTQAGGAAAEPWLDEPSGVRFDTRVNPEIETFWEPPDRLTPCGPVGAGARPGALSWGMTREELAALLREMRDRFAAYCQTSARYAAVSAKTAEWHAMLILQFLRFLTVYQGAAPSAVTEFDLREFLYHWWPERVYGTEEGAKGVSIALRRFFAYLADVEGIECPWAEGILRDRKAFLAMVKRAPGIGQRDAGSEWLAPLTVDLELRVLLPVHDPEAIAWGEEMGDTEFALFRQVRRLWLEWRDEIIREGVTEPAAVLAALRDRQREWAKAPNVWVSGETPVRAVARERRRAAAPRQ